jgi:hypothetical protein
LPQLLTLQSKKALETKFKLHPHNNLRRSDIKMGARGLKRSLALLLIGLALGAVPTTAFYQLTRGVPQKEVVVFAGAAAAPIYREAAAHISALLNSTT